MRRMLDPKTIGGGGTPSHAYRIMIDTFCWFLSFSTKDYGFKIGEKTELPEDFYTNDYYKDLRSRGYHPAGGYYNGDKVDLLASRVEIFTDYTIGGYRPSDKTTARSTLNITRRIVYIVQLS